MRIKLLLSTIAMVMMIAGINAQTQLGLEGGLNLPRMAARKVGADALSTSVTASLYLTGYMKKQLTEQLSIQPGISLQGKGGRDRDFNATYHYLALDIPVNIVYDIPIGKRAVFVGGGPFVGMNLAGKYKSSDEGWEDIGFLPIFNSVEDADEWSRFDYGVNLLAGYRLRDGLFLKLGYGLGLANIDPRDDWRRHTRILSFGIGREF